MWIDVGNAGCFYGTCFVNPRNSVKGLSFFFALMPGLSLEEVSSQRHPVRHLCRNSASADSLTMATTTGGFSKVHTVTSSTAVGKEWLNALNEGYLVFVRSVFFFLCCFFLICYALQRVFSKNVVKKSFLKGFSGTSFQKV